MKGKGNALLRFDSVLAQNRQQRLFKTPRLPLAAITCKSKLGFIGDLDCQKGIGKAPPYPLQQRLELS
jgi:hypothetical protein